MKRENKNPDVGDLTLEQLVEVTSLKNEISSSKRSYFGKIKYIFNKSTGSIEEFIQKAPLLGYSLKRIIYAFFTLYLAIAFVFIMLRIVTTDAAYLSDVNLEKLGIQYGDERYNTLLNNRMKAFGVAGPMLEQMFIYLRNITPFIPKDIILNPVVDGVTGEVGGELTRM